MGPPTEVSERIARQERLERRLRKDMIHTLVEYCDCTDELAIKMDSIDSHLNRMADKAALLATEILYVRQDMRQHMTEGHGVNPKSPPPPPLSLQETIIKERYTLLITIVGSITTFLTTYIGLKGVP